MYSSVLKTFLLITFIFYSCLLTAAEQAASDEEESSEESTLTSSPVLYVQPLKIAQMLLRDLKRFVPDHQISTLTTETGNEFISLVKPQTSGIPRGIAFIVPDINQSTLQQAANSALFNQLSDYGWHSMILTMPHSEDLISANEDQTDTPTSTVPDSSNNSAASEPNGNTPASGKSEGESLEVEEEDGASESEEGSDDDAIEQKNNSLYQQLQIELPATFVEPEQMPNIISTELNSAIGNAISQRVSAAIQAAQSEPGFYLMICQGKSCVWLTDAINNGELPKPDALVMLSAHFPELERNRAFAENMAQTDFPTLDLYLSRDNRWVNNAIDWRRKMAKRHFKTEYRQRQINSIVSYAEQGPRVLKELLGFIRAVGM